MSVSLRFAVKSDLPEILSMVKELALYEKAPEQVTNTLEKMEEDGFGTHPIFHTILAETPTDGVVGMSLYYFRYSTWKGKRLYLEDLIVREKFRGFGYGKLLFNATVEKAKETNCTGMMWQVLDWNKPAIDFYKTYGTRFDEEWLNCHLDF